MLMFFIVPASHVATKLTPVALNHEGVGSRSSPFFQRTSRRLPHACDLLDSIMVPHRTRVIIELAPEAPSHPTSSAADSCTPHPDRRAGAARRRQKMPKRATPAVR